MTLDDFIYRALQITHVAAIILILIWLNKVDVPYNNKKKKM